jgi:hypothetical protein
VVVTPAGKSSREVSRRSHSDFSIPRICEQSGRFLVVPTPRDAGGTVSVCVATRARFALAVSRALRAEFGWLGTTVCCGIELEAGVGVDGGGDVSAGVGVGADGGGDVVG